jgi:Ner family transcriptional regulator
MNHDLSPENVKKLITATGITLSELGIQNGFSHAAVSITLKRRQPFVQQIIADRVGMRPQDIWPSRYDKNGSPVRADARGNRVRRAA